MLLCSWLLLAGCESVPTTVSPNLTHTLVGNGHLPNEEIRDFYPPEQWAQVADRPYAGFVILRGVVNWDNEVKANRVRMAYPDESRVELARRFSSEIKLPLSMAGSRVKPNAEVYVVFYDNDDGSHTALVFAKQLSQHGMSQTIARDRYLTVVHF